MAGPSGMFGGVRPGSASSGGKSAGAVKSQPAGGAGKPVVNRAKESSSKGSTKAGSAPAPKGHTLAK